MEGKTIYSIVVAEDEPMILDNIVKKISNMDIGFQVVGAADDGQLALEMIEKYSPDVLITDIRMPVMDGIELIRVVFQKYPNIKKIVVSGFDDFKYAQQALKYETSDYLLKPLKTEELLETLMRIRISLDAEGDKANNILKLKENYAYSPQEIAQLVEVYIKENYTQEINFDLISQNFNFNQSYLSKVFTKYIGMNPSKYLISLRINKAKQLLHNNSELSIKDIGELSGYPNQFYFSRIFKSVVGKSPASYRENN